MVTLEDIERNIRLGKYPTTDSFTAEFKWIVHNCHVYFGCVAQLSDTFVQKIAKSLLKTCKQEMNQIETCAECYCNANSKVDWFIEVCDRPHILLWAKLKGFPYWPAKGMAVNGAMLVDVRFFGAHDRAWVPIKDCYLYSADNPNAYKNKKNTIVKCIGEIEQHIAKIRQKFGTFVYPAPKSLYDPARHLEQLQMMIPTYKEEKQPQQQTIKPPPPESVDIGVPAKVNSPQNSPPQVSLAQNPQLTKTNLTYKIIKTADNSLLISPVVKPTPSLEAVVEPTTTEHKAVDQQQEMTKDGEAALTPLPPSLSRKKANSSAIVEQREVVKPTKIVIKNSYDENNQKHYELVSRNETTTKSKSSTDLSSSSSTSSLSGNATKKRKADNWKSAVWVKKTKADDENMLEAASPQLLDEGDATTKTEADLSQPAPANKITLRRLTRTAAIRLQNAEAVDEVITPVNNEPVIEEKKDHCRQQPETERKLIVNANVVVADGSAMFEEKADKVPMAKAESVEKTPLEVLGQLPQISIVPSRKASLTSTPNAPIGPLQPPPPTAHHKQQSHKRSSDERQSADDNSRFRRKTRSGSKSRDASTHSVTHDASVQLGPMPRPENLQIKIEPISDDDEIEIQVATVSEHPRQKPVVNGAGGGGGSSSSSKSRGNSTEEPQPLAQSQPRARKTFGRNFRARPIKSTVTVVQSLSDSNMVSIPRHCQADLSSFMEPSSASTSYSNEHNNSSNGNNNNSARQSPHHMLEGSITADLAAAVTTVISQGGRPPRLQPKPAGTLQSDGDVIFPTAAGSASRILMENSHKMADFFRSVIEDTISDMADKGCLEAKVQLLQLELEKLQYEHNREVAELKTNSGKNYTETCYM